MGWAQGTTQTQTVGGEPDEQEGGLSDHI